MITTSTRVEDARLREILAAALDACGEGADMKPLTIDECLALQIGDIIYECAHGMNIMERVVSLPVAGKGYEGRRTFECDVVNEITGQPIHLLKTEGLEHYGPPLYREPQYVSRDSKGKWKAHLVGQPAKETTN